jgi:hypothetical protein
MTEVSVVRTQRAALSALKASYGEVRAAARAVLDRVDERRLSATEAEMVRECRAALGIETAVAAAGSRHES